MNFSAELARRVAAVEAGIERWLPAGDTRPVRLHEAMRYAMQAGGKRLRPVLALAAAEACRPAAPGAGSDPIPAGVALECIHTYSLIHDDLPCMDDDDLRRGRPTVHKAFDEATALLAGDALLTHAFALLAQNYSDRPALALALTAELADAAGSRRLIGGQMADLLAENQADATAEELEFIHLNKTAAMIEASLVMGAQCAGADQSTVASLRRAGRDLGLAFQIIDDILDATADSATLGKTAGKDAKAGKTTFVKLHGIPEATRLARLHTDAAVEALRQLPGDTAFLIQLTESLAERIR